MKIFLKILCKHIGSTQNSQDFETRGPARASPTLPVPLGDTDFSVCGLAWRRFKHLKAHICNSVFRKYWQGNQDDFFCFEEPQGATGATPVFPHPALLSVTKKSPLPYGGTSELKKNTHYHIN